MQDTLSGYGSINVISVAATSSDAVPAATSEVEAILDARHGVTAADRDYSIFSAASFLSALGTVTTLITVLLAAVASISLLVGGIGVMNIMLVTVTERTREIGLRKAIGAPQSVIIAQFMFEAVLLSMIGGVAGVDRRPPRLADQDLVRDAGRSPPGRSSCRSDSRSRSG